MNNNRSKLNTYSVFNFLIFHWFWELGCCLFGRIVSVGYFCSIFFSIVSCLKNHTSELSGEPCTSDAGSYDCSLLGRSILEERISKRTIIGSRFLLLDQSIRVVIAIVRGIECWADHMTISNNRNRPIVGVFLVMKMFFVGRK